MSQAAGRKRIYAVLALAGLAGCAEPAGVRPMVVPAEAAPAGPADPSLLGAVCVEQVRGGKSTNPLWVSEVDNRTFLAALEGSLRNYGLFAAEDRDCRYGIEAHLLGLSQPYVAFDVEVTANVNYRVREAGQAEPYYLSTTTTSYTARMDEAEEALFASRLRQANEGAMRKNIRDFVEALMARKPTP